MTRSFLATLLLYFSVTFACATETDDTKPFWDTLRFPISCDTLIIADYRGDTPFTETPATIVPFNREACARELRDTISDKLLEPFFEMMAQEVLRQVPETETAMQRKKRAESDEKAVLKTVEALQAHFREIFSLCRELGPKISEGSTRLCYFGGPDERSDGPFRAAFNSMVGNSLPAGEALCVAEPLESGKRLEPEFSLYLFNVKSSLSWLDIKASLTKDGFLCQEDRCIKMVLGVGVKQRGGLGFLYSGSGTIVPRVLTVYKGDWNFSENMGRCLEPENITGSECKLKPARGAEAGICMAGEDWHQWGVVLCAFNACEE